MSATSQRKSRLEQIQQRLRQRIHEENKSQYSALEERKKLLEKEVSQTSNKVSQPYACLSVGHVLKGTPLPPPTYLLQSHAALLTKNNACYSCPLVADTEATN